METDVDVGRLKDRRGRSSTVPVKSNETNTKTESTFVQMAFSVMVEERVIVTCAIIAIGLAGLNCRNLDLKLGWRKGQKQMSNSVTMH